MSEPYEPPSKVPTGWATVHPVPVGWMRQFRYLIYLFERISHLQGDVVECGVGEGNTLAMLAYLIGSEDQQTQRTLWGFDSFEGWPEASPFDASPRNPRKGEWKVPQEKVELRLEESGIRKDFPALDVRMVKGFFNETLPDFADGPIALLHIDCDLYEGYRDALTYLFSKVVGGGVVAFDEYLEFPNTADYDFGKIEKWPGCTKAVDEYLQSLTAPQKLLYWPETKKYYLVKR